MFSCEFCEITKNTFSYRAPPAAASVSSWGSLFNKGLWQLDVLLLFSCILLLIFM